MKILNSNGKTKNDPNNVHPLSSESDPMFPTSSDVDKGDRPSRETNRNTKSKRLREEAETLITTLQSGRTILTPSCCASSETRPPLYVCSFEPS